MKKLFILGLTIMMVGCVSYQPVPEGYQGPLSLIKDTSTSVSSTKEQFFELSKVDGRSVQTSSGVTYERNYGRGMAMTVATTERSVPSQECTLSIQGITHVAAPILALGGGMYSVKGDVNVTLEESVTYYIRGELSKEYSAVWVEDSEGNLVSNKIEKKEK